MDRSLPRAKRAVGERDEGIEQDVPVAELVSDGDVLRRPAAVREAQQRSFLRAGVEPDLHLARVPGVLRERERVHEAATRLPDRHLAPVVAPEIGVQGVDPALDARLDLDVLQGLGVRGVPRVPPLADPLGVDREGMLRRAGEPVLERDRGRRVCVHGVTS